MVHVFTHHEHPDPDEHPVIAVIALIAIIAAIVVIAGARLAIHGTDDLEAALSEPAAQSDRPVPPKPDEERDVDAAVTSSRFATGFSP